MHTDMETIIRQAQDGDADALGELYESYRSKMKDVCLNILRDSDRSVADDLVHDAFILAFASLDNLKDPQRFGGWLAAITKNVTLKYLAAKQHSELSLSLLPDDAACFADHSHSAEQYLSYRYLADLINQLPDGYREVFRLAVIEGFSHKEIAAMLGIQPHSSSSQLFHAKSMLRKMLGVYRAITVIVVILIAIPTGRLLFTPWKRNVESERVAKSMEDNKHGSQPHAVSSGRQSAVTQTVARRKYRAGCVMNAAGSTLFADTGSVASAAMPAVQEERQRAAVAEQQQDSTSERPDIYILPEIETAATPVRKKSKWKMLAIGCFGPAMAQNAYKLLTDNSLSQFDPSPLPDGIDTPTRTFSTWEEYYAYIINNNLSSSADTLALIDIAGNNTGKIVEQEHHDKPVTVGLSLTKSLNSRVSVETGLQYSMLKSTFTMGRQEYNIQRTQKIHYIGIPLKLSYEVVGYKRLSTYVTGGVLLNIPVGKSSRRRLTSDGVSMTLHSDSAYVGINLPLQWSVSAGMGMQYHITPNIGLYIEPSLNYYVPTGSSVHTIWTEQPFTFSVPFGIRLSF